MQASVKPFAESAKHLARNPLGIIALFIVLIYAFATSITGFSSGFQPGERMPLIYFLVIYPVLVLGVFGWLVSRHHQKLYSPGDYKQESNFVLSVHPQLSGLTVANQGDAGDENDVVRDESVAEHLEVISESMRRDILNIPTSTASWMAFRKAIYKRNRELFIAHVLEPSKKEGQEFDIFIYLLRHAKKDYSDIRSAEFFFGKSWGNRVFMAKKIESYIGVRTSAYGPFLCVCKVTFNDGEVIMLNKYVDFEMGKLLKDAQAA